MKTLPRRLLGTELSLWGLSKLARSFPESSLIRKLCWHAGQAAKNKRSVRKVRTQEGFAIHVDLSDHGFQALFFGRDLEPEVTRLIKRVVEPGQTWWDLGANVGWYSFLLSKHVGP